MRRDETPTAWSDDADDLIFTRESLDEVAPRASSPPQQQPPAERADTGGAMPDGDTSLQRADDAERPTRPTLTGARIAWGNSLTMRQKALRGGAMTLLVLMTLYLLVGGPATTQIAIRHASSAITLWLHPPKPQPTLAERGYIAIKSPPGAYNLSTMSVVPATGRTNAAWACWASPYSANGQQGGWSAHAFYTGSGGSNWSGLALPTATAQGCSISADSESSSSALFVLSQGLAPDGSCIAPYLYLTSDTGATWTHVAWPIGPSDGACHFTTALQGGVIYVWSNTPVIRGTNPYLPPTGRLIVSHDAGQTWAPADVGLDDSAGFDIVGFRPGGCILATIADVHSSGISSILMMSLTYGASWINLGELPGAFPQVFVSSDEAVTDHGGWGRLYELAEVARNGSPVIPQQPYLSTAYIGQGWTTIPLPRLPSEEQASALSRQPLVVGLGPAGSLEVERGIVDSANAQLSPSRLLWVWNPEQGQWLLDPQAIPGNLQLQGATWSAGDQIFWVTTLQLGVPPVLQIYTKVYPADLLLHIQQAPPGT